MPKSAKHLVATRFKPGVSGNPAGRKPGVRDGLGQNFLAALSADFKAHGKAAIETVRRDDPSTYVKVVAGLLPKEHQLGVSESLANALRRLAGQPDTPLPGEPADLRDGGVAGHA